MLTDTGLKSKRKNEFRQRTSIMRKKKRKRDIRAGQCYRFERFREYAKDNRFDRMPAGLKNNIVLHIIFDCTTLTRTTTVRNAQHITYGVVLALSNNDR